MNWRVKLKSETTRFLTRISQKDSRRISDVLRKLSTNPFAGDITKLQGETVMWRRRVGSYRIVFEIVSDERVVFVHKIKRRTSTTY